MNCQECELALAGEERNLVVDQHVAAHMAKCSACHKFALELRENSEALRAFAMESMPGLKVSPRELPGGAPGHQHGRQHVAWWAAVAAVLALGFVSSWAMLTSRSSLSRVLPGPSARIVVPAGAQAAPVGPWPATRSTAPLKTVPAPIRHRALSRSQPKDEPHILQVKMLTDDPDVVIYWQIEN